MGTNTGSKLALALVFLALASNMGAQTLPAAALKQDRGFTAGVEFDGSFDSSANVYEIDSTIGYNFGKHFTMDLGLPFYFAQSPTDTSTGQSNSSNQFGNPALGLHFKFPNPVFGYNMNLTATFPTAKTGHGFSTGRVTYDWSNHVEHGFSWLTPFVDAGIANSILDTRLYHRPYTSLGYNAHFAAGAKRDIWKFFTVEASAYDILPWGEQKIYSRVAGQTATSVQHGRVFQANAVNTGTADIARDYGYSATLEAGPSAYLDLGVGYARSVRYVLNTVSFSVGVNLGSLTKRTSH